MPLFRRTKVVRTLAQHLRSIGVEAQHEEEKSGNLGTLLGEVWKEVFGREAFSVELADMQVRLRQIHSIEVCRDTWTEERTTGRVSVAFFSWRVRRRVHKHRNRANYVVAFEPGVTLPAGIQASIIAKRTFWRKIKSFEWRAFPAIASRLKADELLNSRLLGHLNKDLPDDLSIRKLSDDRASITTNYNPRRLPSREALRCIEDIAVHVSDFVTEWNRDREAEIEHEPDSRA